MRRTLLFACLASALAVSGVTLVGQEPPQRPFEPGSELTPAEILALFDTYAVLQAQEMLELNDTQYAQFITRLKALQELRRKNQRERQALIQSLRRLTNARPLAAESAIREQLKAFQDHDTRAAADLQKAHEAVDQVLDVRQQARFRVFEEQMERRKLEFLMRARQGNPPRRVRPPAL